MDPWSYISPSSGDILNHVYDKEFSESYFDVDHENTNGRGFGVQHIPENNEPEIIRSCSLFAGSSSCGTGLNAVSNPNLEANTGDSQDFVQPTKIKQEIISPNDLAPRNVEKTPASECQAKVKLEPVTPKEPEETKQRGLRRRSMSVNAIMQTTHVISHMSQLDEALENMSLSTSIHEESSSTSTSTKWKSLKSFSTCSSQTNLHTTAKFVSMAEAIYRLQRDTPKRFHSSSRIQDHRAVDAAANRKRVQQLKSTIPQSPALLAKTRVRPVTALSQKEIEDLEAEQYKKYHIKAMPISRAVLYGNANIPAVHRRPNTQPEPFKLTQIMKKPAPAEKKIVFTARPVPKHILEKPSGLPKKIVPSTTVPKTPTFMAHRSRSLESVPNSSKEASVVIPQKRLKCPLQVAFRSDGMPPEPLHAGHVGVPLAQKNILYPRKPKPFSFEQKDKERQTKKMEKIQQYYDEEKRLREFHANPLPAVLKNSKIPSPKPRIYEKRSDFKKENKENVSEEQHVFKARPPLVLFKEPFVPTKKERPVLEPCQVQLTTEIRARERDAFNQKIKEKEEQHEILKRLAEEERAHREEKEDAAFRAQLVHKAAPVKHYAAVKIHPSEAPLTRPAPPKFTLNK